MIRTRLAKTLYALSGYLMKIKTRQRFVRLVSVDPWVTEPAEARWSSWRFSYKVLALSNRVDPEHWEHWALGHRDDCLPIYCHKCKGWICTVQESEDD